MHTRFKAIGLSHQGTPIAVRESVTFTESRAKEFMLQLRDTFGIAEAMVLSTCNRTEVYYSSDQDLAKPLVAFVDVFHGLTGADKAAPYFQALSHSEAVNHLFEVSLGLRSKVLGDIQITNQVKNAYQWSADVDMAGPFLHRLLHTIFFTNKRAVQETTFRDGTASTASAAVNIAQQFISNYVRPIIAVVGLGEIGQNVAENLKGTDAKVILLNRTAAKAESLAATLGFEARGLDQLEETLEEANVIISAVNLDEPLITDSTTSVSFDGKLLVDMSVPRSIAIDESVHKGVLLYNIDHLNEKTSDALISRQKAVPEVQAIISEAIADFKNWSQELEVSPTIRKLKMALEDIRQQEMARYLGKMDSQQAKMLEKATKGMMQKVMKLPVLQLKAACKRGEAETLVEVLNELFDLEKAKDVQS